MTIAVENGTGQSTAETYATVAEYRAFWVGRNDAVILALTPTDTELEGDLREGFAFVNQRRRYRGLKVSPTQAGAFPRNYLYDAEGNLSAVVPPSVKEAQMRAARAHRTASLFARTERAGALQSQSVDGVVARSFFAPTRSAGNDAFDQIDKLLDEWATSPAGSVRLIRG